jgi:cyclase
MNEDGVRHGYDIAQLRAVRDAISIPLVGSGGAGTVEHFSRVFRDAKVDGALAASVFHRRILSIGEIKDHLRREGVTVRT